MDVDDDVAIGDGSTVCMYMSTTVGSQKQKVVSNLSSTSQRHRLTAGRL